MADDRMRELEERYEGYSVYDRDGDRIGKVDDLFVDESDREEYIGVRMGLFGLSGTTLIPMDIVRVNEQERAIEVSESKEHVKDGPTYSDDDEVTGEFEDRIRRHFGLESLEGSAERGSYGRTAGDNPLRGDRTEAAAGAQSRDVYDEREHEPRGQEEYRNREDMGRESSMGAAGAGGSGASGGISDLETGEPGRGDREGADVGNMTRGHRAGTGEDFEGTGQEMTRGGEGPHQGGGGDEAYREGYREGLREGLREAGILGEPGSRGEGGDRGGIESGDRAEPGDREGLGASGETRGSGAVEGEVPRRGGERGGVGAEGMAGDRERSGERPEGGTREEEGGLTRVWRRINR